MRIQPPPDLRGRARRDRVMQIVATIGGRWDTVSHWLGKGRPPVTPVNRVLPLTVEEVRREAVAEDVLSLTLSHVDGDRLPDWHPGAHLDLLLPSGRMRQYSLTGDPADLSSYRIAVRSIPDGGGGSLEVHTLQPGDRVSVLGPRNAFPYVRQDAYLFVAGGIGITPILPMVRDAARRGADYRIVYTGRSLSSLPFVDELREIAGYRLWVRTDDEHGLPTGPDLIRDLPAGAAIYCCGPPPMISAIRSVVPVQVPLFSERFSAPPVIGGTEFTVTLARSGARVQVAADESALAAIRRVRPAVMYSCQQGFCGTCKVRVLDGTVEHVNQRPLPGYMNICVSRGQGDLTLDL
ncbi:oxidoreductase [Pseudonocardiaceae bacterium YIM PH 21723]|nr:oxidoreductase [Pseudonocardiaceae bacterium YIM PH 21723]